MPHQLNATGFLQKVKSFSPAMIKWVWSGANVGEWSGGMEEKVCIGLNCEPCMCWEGGRGRGEEGRRGKEESRKKGEKRREIGVCELHLSLSRVSLNKCYTTVVYDKGWFDWLTNHMPIALRNNVVTMHMTHEAGTHASGLHSTRA